MRGMEANESKTIERVYSDNEQYSLFKDVKIPLQRVNKRMEEAGLLRNKFNAINK
jgi:DNA polymerase I-like protein with 3'-5' exonuclease and polymerase domains